MKLLFKGNALAIVILLLTLSVQSIYSQNDSISGVAYIQKLIDIDSLQEATTELTKQVEYFKAKKNYDTLTSYISLVGSFKLANGDSKIAIDKAENLIVEIKLQNNATTTTKALLELSNLYFNARQHNKIYEIGTEALTFANQIQPSDYSKISQIEYNLGTASLNLGNIEQGKVHLYNSKRILEKHLTDELSQLYNTYNSIGRFQASKTQLDSSTYYYKKALKTLSQMDSTEVNKDYWKAIVNNNISLNFQNTGKTDQAIEYSTNAIFDYQKFINVVKDESKKLRAKRFRLSTIDNLGTFYEGIGEYNRAVDLMEYSYNEKRKFLKDNDPNIVFSLVILGHTNLNAKNYIEAVGYTDKALSLINENPTNYTFLHSFTLTIRASICEAMQDYEGAKRLYLESEALYNDTFDGTYSRDYLDAIIQMSKFYTKINDTEKAIELACLGYDHTHSKEFQNVLVQFHHTQNMADVYFGLKDYEKALKYSEESLNFFKDNKLNAKTLSDSIQNEFRKPRALLVNAKSKYHLSDPKDEGFLKSLLAQIEEGIAILNRRKIIIKTPDDLNLLIEDNNDLFNFAKQIRLDLFEKTKNESYLNDLVSLHESSLYNRIRSRLNLRNNIVFVDIPEKVTKQEAFLKNELTSSLSSSESTMESFFETNVNWNNFLDSLSEHFPKYYKMRYASIEEPLGNLQSKISDKTTIVRYLFIENNLYAFVVTATEKNIFKLNFDNVNNSIYDLAENQSNIEEASVKYYELYKILWQPFENRVTTENVMIIPDGELFNLSFETLTPTKINAFEELKTNSLLANHIISYNYSLLLLDKERKPIEYNDNFVAFAPEFNNKMKEDYSLTITDSINIDKTYLTLLSQPFSVDLAKEYSKLFNGASFINEKASKQVFTKEANEHKIIHIGTHAESNNLSPELSRLIFAKNNNNDENSLYTYEIYNQNLNSNLAILTACETGKPTYQSGEGMISLAHAFNYAGSESILTSLWKIDEQSSTKIIESFFNYLAEGLPKDKALQQAKLDYITTAEGRTVAPQYWAGLVLIGDTAPIDISTSQPWWLILLVAVSTLSLIVMVLFNRKEIIQKKGLPFLATLSYDKPRK